MKFDKTWDHILWDHVSLQLRKMEVELVDNTFSTNISTTKIIKKEDYTTGLPEKPISTLKSQLIPVRKRTSDLEGP